MSFSFSCEQLRISLCAAAVAVLCGTTHAAPQPNTLTTEEQAAGWKLLFDGDSLAEWQVKGKPGAPIIKGWQAADGELKLPARGGGGDILTKEEFENFELSFDWKIPAGANSGLKYNLISVERGLGCEYQLLDDAVHPDGKVGPQRQTGALYDVLPPADSKIVQPVRKWNTSRVVVQGNQVEHWLNGTKVLGYEFGSQELLKRVAASKFKKEEGFGTKKKSPILLQDHGDEVSFRNLKIRPL